jgi:hypothetical protein
VSLDDLVELRAMGITPEELARVHATGTLDRDELRALSAAPRPPRTPPPPPQPPGDPDDD